MARTRIRNNMITQEVIDKIGLFISTNPTHKLIIHNEEIDVNYLNVGQSLSTVIKELKLSKHIVLEVKSKLEEQLNAATYIHPVLGEILAIENLGILFERDLKINFNSILVSHSRNKILLVKWEGIIDENILYFTSKKSGIKTDIKHLNYLNIATQR